MTVRQPDRDSRTGIARRRLAPRWPVLGGMHDDLRRYWAWLLSGAILDAALAATFLLGALAFAPSLLQDEASWHGRMALLGSAIALVHLVLLPILVWPGARLSARDLGVALVRTATVPLAVLLGSVTGIAAGIGSLMPLMAVGALFASFLTRTMGDAIVALCILTAVAVGYFTGGAVCCGLVAHGAAKWAGPGHVPIREHTAALGGGAAAFVLAVLGADGAIRQLLDLNAVALLQAGMAVAGAGLPHLLLTCRDLAHQPPVLATWPVAARRLAALLMVLGASDGLLLRVIHGWRGTL